MPKACVPEVELHRFVTIVELRKLQHGKEGKMPIVKGTTQLGNTSTPGNITVERSTR